MVGVSSWCSCPTLIILFAIYETWVDEGFGGLYLSFGAAALGILTYPVVEDLPQEGQAVRAGRGGRRDDLERGMSTQNVAHPITHILIGTDGSEVSERVLEWTKDIAKLRKASVTVVCAFDSPKSFRKRGSLYLAEARDSLEAEAKEIVAETVAELRDAGVEASGVAYRGRGRRRHPGSGRRRPRPTSSSSAGVGETASRTT